MHILLVLSLLTLSSTSAVDVLPVKPKALLVWHQVVRELGGRGIDCPTPRPDQLCAHLPSTLPSQIFMGRVARQEGFRQTTSWGKKAGGTGAEYQIYGASYAVVWIDQPKGGLAILGRVQP